MVSRPLLLSLFLVSVASSAQQAPSADIVFRSETRLVIVDAIVRDGKGNPIRALTKDQFEIKEDGKVQKIAQLLFTEGSGSKPQQPLPSNIYTNDPKYQDGGRRYAVLLIDMLNTPFNERTLMRDSIRKFVIEQMPRDQKIAIFLLTDKLQLLQDFTSNPVLLRRVAEAYSDGHRDGSAKVSGKEEVERLLLQQTNESKSAIAAQDPSQSLGAAGGVEEQLRRMVEAWDRIEDVTNMYQTTYRANVTTTAMKVIARWLQGRPGRKSMVWMSGSFPIALTPDQRNIGWYTKERASFEVQVRQATDALNQAQVAMYPVDVRGLTPTLSGERTTGLALRAEQLGNTFKAEQATSIELAEMTGGTAFANRNDLDRAIAGALEDGKEYYTLAYYPDDKQWDGKFRNIEVKVKEPGAKVHYRKGYLATSTNDWKTVRGENEVASVMAGPLQATEIYFYAMLSETSANPRAGVVALSFPSNALKFQEKDGQYRAAPSFFVIATSGDGKLLWSDQKVGEIRLNPEQFAIVRQQGMRYPVAVQLPASAVRFRVGVRDNLTGAVGTLEIPIPEAPKK